MHEHTDTSIRFLFTRFLKNFSSSLIYRLNTLDHYFELIKFIAENLFILVHFFFKGILKYKK